MIYQFTGQPGHGKTLTALDMALDFKAKGREVYACNVRQLDFEKTGFKELTPEQFRDWMNVLPQGAVCLVDEAYEHDMLPKRPPSAKVPLHVERLATHRHLGLDFIFVCQSPDKQMDGFVHDLIERHIHVRRRFGTAFQHLREFDRFERNPEKATPLVLRRQRLPKRVFGLYKSTELDTTERRIPWYFFAFAVGVPLGLGFMYWTFGGMKERLGGEALPVASAQAGTGANGAVAPVAPGPSPSMTPLEYLQRFVPRIPTQPWSAPAYDQMAVSSEPPRLFCMASGAGRDSTGQHQDASCTCLTEQGTRYRVPQAQCERVAEQGQYEPYYDERSQERMDGVAMGEANREELQRIYGAGDSIVIPGEPAAVGPDPGV